MLGREVRTENRYLRIVHVQVKTTPESLTRREKTEGREREAEDRTVGNTYFLEYGEDEGPGI